MATRASYGSQSGEGGGRIAAVAVGSAAERAGIVAGEAVAAVDGEPVADIIDWRWLADDTQVTVTIQDAEGALREVDLEREPGESWGIEFDDPLFDRIHTCRNDCVFCFMAQLPEGLRPALYVRDDDYRLSFLQGNFVTLTNLTDADVARIIEQRLSPLYVSLHAVDPEVRARLVCARRDDALERFDELAAAGIAFHVQIVLVPGVNDGDELERTLTWLAERPSVQSVGVVPLGYTRFQDRFSAGYEDPTASALVIQQVQSWQLERMDRHEPTWVHLADEFYLNARAPFPAFERYDDFPQYENGIGIVRTFVAEVMALRTAIQTALLGLPAEEERLTLVTGMMAATTLAGALEACDAVGRVRLLVVPNGFLGGNVSVAGLLAGRDVVSGIAHDASLRCAGSQRPDAYGAVYALPDVMFNADGLTIDDLSAEDIRSQTGADVRVVSADAAGLLDAVQEAGE